MIGPQTKGSFSVTFEESLALEIMFRMLGEIGDAEEAGGHGAEQAQHPIVGRIVEAYEGTEG